MDFTSLLVDFSSSESPPENKQRLNLSHRTYSILLNDMAAFQLAHISKKETLEVSSKLINRVFCRFCRTAQSSIALTLKQKKADLIDLLANITPETAREAAIESLLDFHESQLTSYMEKRMEKGHAFSVRLDDDTMDYLTSQEGQDEGPYYKDRVGLYIKAVLEEYAELPYVEREKIYYSEECNTIETAVVMQQMLNITLHSQKNNDSAYSKGKGENNRLYIKPLGIQQDSGHLYHYLIGIMSSQREGPWAPGAIRLSSIKTCKPLGASAFISQDNRKEIEREIQKNGVQFLSSRESTEKIIVEFTPQGEKLYRRMLHLRPLYTAHQKNTRIYEFDCTPFHAEAYFFKFGQDAKILAPQTLADSFLQKYEAAAQVYR